ncbi:MAG: membrane protein insertase YidC [Thermodesulfobacteria bacterium]|nr:membrane protein insertase YidC [Thermodesulfobacteriota bacterium]
MDTKRVIIAIALSFVVILLFQFIYTKLFPASTFRNYYKTTNSTSSAPSQSSLKKTEILKLIKNYKSYYIFSPNYNATLISAGVRFSNFTLNKYFVDIKKTKHVQLVSAPEECLPLEIYLEKHSDLGAINYASEVKSKKIVVKNGTKTVSFYVETPEILMKKSFTFKNNSYFLDLKISIINRGSKVLKDRLLIRGAFKPFVPGTRYIFKGPFYYTSHLEEVKLKDKLVTKKGKFKYVGYEGNYFMVAVIPMNMGNQTLYATFRKLSPRVDEFILWGPKFSLKPGEKLVYKFKVYMGPKKLEDMEKEYPLLGKALYFGFFDILAKPLLYVLKFSHKYTHNFGWDIIILTILLRIIFFPLNQMSFKSMKKMKEIQPVIERIRKKYKDDPERLNKELMNVYRTYKINPFSGCLPILIQIPIFIAFYEVLLMAIELRHAPFMLWINDLSAPERLYIDHIHIPLLGGIPLLTILMGVSMYLQQKLTPTSADPLQSKLMLFMPIFFTILFINFPSGLVLYWFVNNILSIIQQYITLKMEKA